MTTPNKRRETDLMKLMMSDFKVEMINDSVKEFFVHLNGPANTPYYGGVWKLRVHLPIDYPYSSPSIGFVNKLYHPNVDWASGTICVNVLNQSWSPMFDLVNVFDAFLPQLLMYPNADDPLNEEAAHLLLSDEPSYVARVREYCERYAKPDEIALAESSEGEPSEDEKDSE